MANHKRHKSKNQRAGCLMCKPWKTAYEYSQYKPSELKKAQDDFEEVEICSVCSGFIDYGEPACECFRYEY